MSYMKNKLLDEQGTARHADNSNPPPFEPPELKDLHPIAFWTMALTMAILSIGIIGGFVYVVCT